jgi:hypothetical protein
MLKWQVSAIVKLTLFLPTIAILLVADRINFEVGLGVDLGVFLAAGFVVLLAGSRGFGGHHASNARALVVACATLLPLSGCVGVLLLVEIVTRFATQYPAIASTTALLGTVLAIFLLQRPRRSGA